jgi:hypothetical protein
MCEIVNRTLAINIIYDVKLNDASLSKNELL